MATYNASTLAEITGTDSHIAPISSPTIKMAQSAAQIAFRQESFFLVLAPVLSADYPTLPTASAASTPAVVAATPVSELLPIIMKDRRSSSVGSDGSFKPRILKLGPVHGGQQNGGSDYVEED